MCFGCYDMLLAALFHLIFSFLFKSILICHSGDCTVYTWMRKGNKNQIIFYRTFNHKRVNELQHNISVPVQIHGHNSNILHFGHFFFIFAIRFVRFLSAISHWKFHLKKNLKKIIQKSSTYHMEWAHIIWWLLLLGFVADFASSTLRDSWNARWWWIHFFRLNGNYYLCKYFWWHFWHYRMKMITWKCSGAWCRVQSAQVII